MTAPTHCKVLWAMRHLIIPTAAEATLCIMISTVLVLGNHRGGLLTPFCPIPAGPVTLMQMEAVYMLQD
eukprot:1761287-Prymnesium_polylepis.1